MKETKKTSQSIFVTLDTLQTETSVPGQNPQMVPHTLPRELFPDSNTFEDKELLLAWTEESGFTHACLQLGVSQFLIKCRAAFKACKKSETWTPELGQANVDTMEWSVMTRPQAGGTGKAVNQARYNDCMAALANGLVAKIAESQLIGMFGPVYGLEMVQECLEAIKAAKK